MIGIISHGRITLLTFPEDLKQMFASYPDIYDMLINKVLFDTEKEEDMQIFFDTLSSLNEENKKGNIGESEETLLVESFRSLLSSYDGMKLQAAQVREAKILDQKEKDNLAGDNLELIY